MAETWTPSPRCHWCLGPFVARTLDRVEVLACSTEACYERQVAWKMNDLTGRLFYLPNPKLVDLEEAIAAQTFNAICIGGSRAGGKSIGLRRVVQRYAAQLEDFSALFLRRTFPELTRNHGRFCPREAVKLGAHYASFKWEVAKTGALVELGHVQDPKDFAKYVGAEYDLIVFDQIEMFTDQQVTELGASLGRIRRANWRGLMLAGENPGGPLSSFVDELFISKTRDRVRYPDYDPNLFHMIQMDLSDNAYVPASYVQFLAGIEPTKRAMYRFGDRTHFPGQFMSSFDKARHVA